MRLRYPSRRRRDGRGRAQCRARDPRRTRLSRAVIIGSGANERIAARVLARRGFDVTVVEEPTAARQTGWLLPGVAEAAGTPVERHDPDPWAGIPLPGGGRLDLWRDPARTAEAIRAVSPRDADQWQPFCERMATLARFLERLAAAPPPDPLSPRFALAVRRLGRRAMTDLMRVLPMPVAELLDDWFESDLLKGALGAAGVLGLHMGPRSGGTAFRFLHEHLGCPPGVFRRPGTSLDALRVPDGAKSGVARIEVSGGRVGGVRLASGETIAADVVLSGASPWRTLAELVDPVFVDPEIVRSARHVRARPAAARMTVALSAAAPFHRLIVAPSLDYLERAYDDAKHGRASRSPHVEAERLSERTLEVLVQQVPEDMGDPDALGRRALEAVMPHLGASTVVQAGRLEPVPADAELTLDQAFWMRPIPRLANYRTPIRGLWLCGTAMHPGPNLPGAAGYLCAQEVLKER